MVPLGHHADRQPSSSTSTVWSTVASFALSTTTRSLAFNSVRALIKRLQKTVSMPIGACLEQDKSDAAFVLYESIALDLNRNSQLLNP